jgi:hypothetical protein
MLTISLSSSVLILKEQTAQLTSFAMTTKIVAFLLSFVLQSNGDPAAFWNPSPSRHSTDPLIQTRGA